MSTLTFSDANSKLRETAKYLSIPYAHVKSFDLPCGYTCPAANVCKSMFNPTSKKIIDGKNCKFRCYAVKAEIYPNCRNMRWNNYNSVRGFSVDEITDKLLDNIPNRTEIIRIHTAGDFFNENYYKAWLQVACHRQDIKFFVYSKMISYVNVINHSGLNNYKAIYSYGGKMDNQWSISTPVCFVDANDGTLPKYAYSLPLICGKNKGYEDYIYIMQGKSFRLGVH